MSTENYAKHKSGEIRFFSGAFDRPYGEASEWALWKAFDGAEVGYRRVYEDADKWKVRQLAAAGVAGAARIAARPFLNNDDRNWISETWLSFSKAA